MQLNAVSVTSSNLKQSTQFYILLGFEFPDFADDTQHIEAIPKTGSARLMIDTKELITKLLGDIPQPSNHAGFALEYDTPQEVDTIAANIQAAGFTIVKTPWDAFWGQRYAVVKDPDGYLIDLYATLPPQS